MIAVTDIALDHRLAPTSLTLAPGTRVAIIGPNGGGKTSLLRALAGIEVDGGSVSVGATSLFDAPPAQRRRLVGFLPASRELHWPIAVRDLLRLGLSAPNEGVIDALIEAFALEGLSKRRSNALSTGERARVLFARALAERPPLLLLDEPLSNLDPYWVLQFLERIDAEARRGATVLASLHDLSLLGRFDRVLLVHGGTIVADTSPDGLWAHPAFEAAFRVVRDGPGFALIR